MTNDESDLSPHIRPLEPSDADEYLRMRCALWPDAEAAELRCEIRSILRLTNYVAFVAARPEGGLGGFVEVSQRISPLGCEPGIGFIEGWYVDPDLRQRGIGTRLVRRAEEWAKERGCTEMGSDAYIDNDLSIKAHQALGYRVSERVVQFKKPLKP